MHRVPNHISPPYSDEVRERSLFHYTTADGLLGILQHNELWSTAYYCANDLTELHVGRGILTSHFREEIQKMIGEGHEFVETFAKRGVDIRDHADKFEHRIHGLMLNHLTVFISCFCKPIGKEDFLHGLLSQWRGYGSDGGYALQFNRERLEQKLSELKENTDFHYELFDAYYTAENELKEEVEKHAQSFVDAFMEDLNSFAESIIPQRRYPNPLAKLVGGPLEAYIDYCVYTKNEHFGEEKEVRLSTIHTNPPRGENTKVKYYNRNGLLVPYVETPKELNIVDCIDWIVVGPGPRIENRIKSVAQLIKNLNLEIKIRPSSIPFTGA